jgi:hypothetical protein
MLVRLLHREAELRKSPEIQMAMKAAEESGDSEWMDVVHDIQCRIVKDSTGISLNDLRKAALRHPEIAFWVKHNRARRGSLKVGDPAPDIRLCRAVDGSWTSLLDRSEKETAQRMVIVAGSLS